MFTSIESGEHQLLCMQLYIKDDLRKYEQLECPLLWP